MIRPCLVFVSLRYNTNGIEYLSHVDDRIYLHYSWIWNQHASIFTQTQYCHYFDRGSITSFPLGQAWGYYVPKREFRIFGRPFSFNPGPFNIKEHTLIVVCTPM